MLDVSDIELIRTIAREGSINRACEQLHITQSTLSKRLARLEDKVGMTLFHRSANGMEASPAARYLMDVGVDLENRLAIIDRQLTLMSEKKTGTVNLGVGAIVEQIFLPKVLLDFAEALPGFNLTIATDTPERLLYLLETGAIDLAIAPFSPQQRSEEYQTVLHCEEEIALIVRNGHPLTEHPLPLTEEAVAAYPIVSPNTPSHLGAQLSLDLPSHRKITCDNYSLAKTVVRNSDFVTGGPESIFEAEIENGELVKLPQPLMMHWKSYGIARPETLLMPTVQAVIDAFAQYMKPYPPGS
ncbi:MAG: LysR family transcriptional regulator [Pseudomonadota bacterium]